MTTPDASIGPAAPHSRADPAVDDTARAVAGEEDVRAPRLELRQGVVTAVDLATVTCDVALGGDTVPIPDVKYVSNFKPTIDDTCLVLVNGPDMWALDRDGRFGSAAFAGYAVGFVGTLQSRTSASYGDLATAGPSITMNVPASGSVLLAISANSSKFNTVNGDARMAVAASGANSWSAGFTYPLMLIGESIASNGVAPYAAMTSVAMLTGINPGSTTFTCKYAANGSTCNWDSRLIWGIPI